MLTQNCISGYFHNCLFVGYMTGSAEKRFVNVSSIVATIDEVEGELFLFSSGTFVNGQTVHLVTGRLIYTILFLIYRELRPPPRNRGGKICFCQTVLNTFKLLYSTDCISEILTHKLLATGSPETATAQQISVTTAARATNTGSPVTSKGNFCILLACPS